MKVYIFTEGGFTSGLGHVVRCSSLYDVLVSRGINVELIIHGDEGIEEVIQNRKCTITNWLSIDYLSSLVDSQVYCVVDSYLANPNMCKFVFEHSLRTLFIDDIKRMKYPGGIVVNPSIYTDDLHYPEIRDEDCLLGNEYVILRNSFKNCPKKYIHNEVKEILVTLGGSDTRNLTPTILNSLKSEYPASIKHVIISKSFGNIDKITTILDEKIKYHFNVSGVEMRDLMLDCDIAISAAGQTIYELIQTGTPFIPIKIIDNQENNVKGILKYKCANRVLDSESIDIHLDLLSELAWIMNPNSRRTLNANMNGIIDGSGSERIINKLLI